MGTRCETVMQAAARWALALDLSLAEVLEMPITELAARLTAGGWL